MTDVVATAPAVSEGAALNQAISDTPEVAAASPKMYTVTVDGQELQVSEDELRRGYSHGSAANKRMAQANEQRQMAEEVLKIFKSNPRMAFEKLGVDAKAFAEQVLNEHLEDEMLTPEQKELKKLRGWAKSEEEKTAKSRAEQQAAQEAAYREQITEQLQTDIIGALETSGMPKNEYTVGRMAYYMEAAISAGFTNVTPKDIIAHVKNEYQNDVKALLGSVGDDGLLSFLGDDFTKKTVKAYTAKNAPKMAQPKTVSPSVSAPKTGEKQIVSPSQFFKRRR